ncbi:ABC transporter ATP-binding protein [Microbacterium murale]|uniref:Peptide/nickel transport system ATP-binding protein n=1 Tax=Microbacterium murale TaxID=1081040 RepID=A0ABU0P5T7_9MICO|nr:ABC transporter ATP-binding protein [Microbacterium murale]MDQ0642691.1 peptide/nickel transport system ATP-binding protein [Microbacterium murale]
MSTEPVLRITDLVVKAETPTGELTLVDGVSLEIAPGEVLSLVGESGSGKSITMLAVMGLLPPGTWVDSGSIRFRGTELTELSERQLNGIRGGELAMVFQDPMTTLNPVRRVGTQLAEGIRLHDRGLSRAQARERVLELLDSVGIPDPAGKSRDYPHQWSGGMRQRALIAGAMAHDPALLIADEPTTALDVTIQAQVMKVLARSRAESDSAMILITHDLGLVAQVADRVAVMYSGRIVEMQDVFGIFESPRHPYTAGLLASVLSLEGDDGGLAYAIPGQPPTPATRGEGCPFQPRCIVGRDRTECGTAPRLAQDARGSVSCFLPLEDGRLPVARDFAAAAPIQEAKAS